MFNLSASVDTPEYIPQWMRQKKKTVNETNTTKTNTSAPASTTVVSPTPMQTTAPVNTTVTQSSYFTSPHLMPPQVPNHYVPYNEFANGLLPPPPLPMMLVPTPSPPPPPPPSSAPQQQMQQPPFPVHPFHATSTLPHDVLNNVHLPSSFVSTAAPTPPAPPAPALSSSSISITRTANNSISTLDHRPPFHSQQIHSHPQSTHLTELHNTHVKTSSELPPLPTSPPTHLNSNSNSAKATPVISAAHTMSLISKRVPARMSPAVTPSSMNPNALEFVPGRSLFTSSLTEHALSLNPNNTSHISLSSGHPTSSAFAHSSSAALSLLPASTMMNHGGLEALPSSTADVEAAVEHEQRRKSEEKESKEEQVTLTHNTNRNDSKANNHNEKSSIHAQDKRSTSGQPVKPSPLWRPSHVHSLTTSPIIAAATVLQQKTEKEILEISERSALNASAASYMPKRTMTRLVLTKPSPLTLVPSADPTEANTEMMLDDLWCLYYLPVNMNSKTITKEAEFNPALVFRIESIPTLWKVFNNIPTPSEMRPSTLYLFRDGIDPKWEHSANRNGGIIKVKISHDQIDEAWELLLCRVMGDSWAASIRDTVNGVVLKVRERVYFLEIWVTKQTPELMKDLAELWQPILGATFTAVYYTHATIQERAEAAANVLAERQRKQRKRH